MTRRKMLWLLAIAALAVLVVVGSAGQRDREFVAQADVPTLQPGTDPLAGIALVPLRIRDYDYRRAAFGDAWTDLSDKTYVAAKHCPDAVETDTLRDPYTRAVIDMPLTVFRGLHLERHRVG